MYQLCISTVETMGGIQALFMEVLLLRIRGVGTDLQLAQAHTALFKLKESY